MAKQQITVEFAATPSGRHDAPVMDCTVRKKKTFHSYTLAMAFISTCSYVYNLDDVVNAVPAELVPDAAEEVKMRESFDVSAITGNY